MKLWKKLVNRASVHALDRLAQAHDPNFLLVRKNAHFKDLSAEAFLTVMNSLIERQFAKDEIIFREGNPGVCMFFIKSGSVEIFASDTSGDGTPRETKYTQLEEGALFGEISTISMSYRTTSARALAHDTVLLTLSSFDLEKLITEFPKDGLHVYRGITDSIISHLIDTDNALKTARRKQVDLECALKELTSESDE